MMLFGLLGPGSVALLADLFHNRLDESLGAFHAGENGLQIEGWLRRVAGGGAIDAMLADHDQGVGEKVKGHGQAASLNAHHELVVFKLCTFFVEYTHISSVREHGGNWGYDGAARRYASHRKRPDNCQQ